MTDETNAGRQPRGLLVLRTVAMPKDANPNGDIFGGWILAQMDLAGGLMAKQIAGSRTVTVTIDKMVFKRPVHVGDAIGVYAELLRVGNSSMDVHLEVWAKALPEDYAAERHLVTEGLFRYVSIDEHHRPRRVPDNPPFFTRSGDTFERHMDDRPGN
ncbi:MAG: acyl-CoA thioesterase [Candidatus Promineifilaceae bacterium]|jgi:acyl-CoA thioesterase YciA